MASTKCNNDFYKKNYITTQYFINFCYKTEKIKDKNLKFESAAVPMLRVLSYVG